MLIQNLMTLGKALWLDECGMLLSAETALLGTIGVVGATVGISAVQQSVSEELTEVAYAFRSLDQSFSYDGVKSEHAWTSGSSYTQPPVAKSRRQLRKEIEKAEKAARKKQEKADRKHRRDNDGKRKKRKKRAVDIEVQNDENVVNLD